MKKSIIPLVVILLSNLFCFAQWSTNPAVNTAISAAISVQQNPTVVSDGNGGAIVVWEDYRNTYDADVYAQRIDASGIVQWTTDGVAICTILNSNQVNPMIASDGIGGAIITWEDYRGAVNVYAQRINSAGAVQWTTNGVLICSITSNLPKIESDGSGGAIIVYRGYVGSDENIYSQRINALGVAQWTNNGVPICVATGNQKSPEIISDGAGGAIMAWEDLRSGGTYTDIYSQRINGSGITQWLTNGVVVSNAYESQAKIKMIHDTSGGALLTWEDLRNQTGHADIYTQKINLSGLPQWTANGVAVCLSNNDKYSPTVTSDGSGGAIISWGDYRNGTDFDIYSQRINVSGVIQWILNGLVVCNSNNNQQSPTIISDNNGGAIITWQDVRSGIDLNIYAQRINPSGAGQWTVNGVLICNASGHQYSPIILPDQTGGAIIVWYDIDIFAQRVNSNGILCSDPNITITGTNSICIGSSAILTAGGANTYIWNTGATVASATVIPVANTTYTVTGTDSNNCYNSQTVTVVVDNTCADVWPGDANSDGLADNLDVLELGLHYTQTGAPRASTSNLWQSYYATNWSGTITNGKNVNHSNCNGDGIISDDDTLAIYTNYNLTHAFKLNAITTTSAQISLVPDQALVAKGTWGTSSIYVGDASTAINNINGVAFTVNYDHTLLETDSVWIEYPTSFINASNQNLKFRKRNFSNGKLYTATTHTINGNVSGFGKIAILHYKIKSTLATDNVLNLSISQANQSNASGAILPLTAGSATLMAIGASVGLNELTNGNYISIHPNPTNGVLTVNSTMELQKIDVMAITGQLLISEVPSSTNHVLHLDHLANGVYFVNLYQNNRIVKREKIILHK